MRCGGISRFSILQTERLNALYFKETKVRIMRRLVVREGFRAFLFRDGKFVRMLTPGRYLLWGRDSFTMHEIGEKAFEHGGVLAVYLKDPDFARSVAAVKVPDGQVALRFVDGNYREILEPGSYAYWNVFRSNTFTLLDTSDEEACAAIPPQILEAVPQWLCVQVQAEEHQAVLLHVDGRFERRLPVGKHFFWRNGRSFSWTVYDLRAQQLEANGQEILTADKVGLRLNFVCSYRIVDPVRLHREVLDHEAQIYVALQLALRELVGGFRFDELLERKNDLPELVLKLLKKSEQRFAVEFLSAGLKDIVLPGEIRDIMNTVLIAEKRAQANVISRREEVASTRSLLNTARLLDENATLYRLKELEYLERICDKVGSISVGNAGGLLEQLGTLMASQRE